MARVIDMVEVTTLSGDERLYVVVDPTGTPLNRYVDVSTLDGRWARLDGQFDVNYVTSEDSGATETLTLAPAHRVEMSEDCTFTFPTPTKDGHIFSLLLTGSYTPTFPASVYWADDTAPTYEEGSLFVFETFDGGTRWIGTLAASGLVFVV